jgi:hypothetical protein
MRTDQRFEDQDRRRPQLHVMTLGIVFCIGILAGCRTATDIVYSGSPAGIVEIPEKYAADSGGYRPGRHGEALWLFSGANYLKYPVLFKKTKVDQGAVSLWFKPSARVRKYSSVYEEFLKFSDEANVFSFVINSVIINNLNLGDQSLLLRQWPSAQDSKAHTHKSLGGIKLDETVPRQFHNVILTWNQDALQVYFDGKLISDQKNGLPIFDGSKACLQLRSGSGVWFDELLVLDKHITPEEAGNLYQADQAWQSDKHTALYVGFDKNLAGKAHVAADGDVVRLFSGIGRPDATFRADDPARIDFYLVNFTAETKKMDLAGRVDDIKKSAVLNNNINLTLAPGQMAKVPFAMQSIRTKGLFWGYFELKDGENQAIAKERIPFALTIAPDIKKYSSKEIPTGLCVPRGLNPPSYVKWAQFKYEFWANQEYAPGKWDFERMDMHVEDALRTGREPMLMFFGTPLFYFKDELILTWNKASNDRAGYTPPEDIEDFKNYVRKIGERYKGKVRHYEVWNEPYWNDPSAGYFYGTAEKYAEMVNATAEILHGIDPENQVGCGMAAAAAWQKTVREMTAGHADYYTLHPYSFASEYDTDESTLLKTRQQLQEAGASTRLANTEMGNVQLQRLAIAPDGYPMSAEEFDKSGKWEKEALQHSYYKTQLRKKCLDPFTSAALIVRALVLSLAGGCEYFLWWDSEPGGVASLTSASHTPSVPSVAYANAAGFLAANSYIRRIDLGAGYLKAYLFRNEKRNDYMIIAWSDKNPETVNLEINDANIKIADIFANPHPFKKIGPVVQTQLTMAPIYLTGLSSIPKEAQPIMKAAQLPEVVFPGSDCEIKATMYNPLGIGLEGELSVEPPPLFAKVPAQSVTLKPKEARDFSFKLAIPEGSPESKELGIVFASGNKDIGRVRIEHTLDIKKGVSARYAKHAPAIDGDLAEWGDLDAFPIVIDKPAQVVYGIPYTAVAHDAGLSCDWRGPQDLSLKAAVACDKTNLYLAIRVFDDCIVNKNARTNPQMTYEGDCVEIFIDARSAPQQGRNEVDQDILQLFLTPMLKDFPAPTYYVMTPKGRKLHGVVLSSTSLADGYALEMQIPLGNFPKLDPAKMKTIGFDIAVDDQDEDLTNRRKSQMMWSGSKDNHSNPSSFGVLIFGEK